MPGASSTRAIDPAIRAGIARALSEFSRNARDRGVRYAREGRVRALELSEHEIRARVRGHSLYTVIWEPDRDHGREWSAECTCPVGLYCKHAFAVATVLMGGGIVADEDEDWFDDEEDDEIERETEEPAFQAFTNTSKPPTSAHRRGDAGDPAREDRAVAAPASSGLPRAELRHRLRGLRSRHR